MAFADILAYIGIALAIIGIAVMVYGDYYWRTNIADTTKAKTGSTIFYISAGGAALGVIALAIAFFMKKPKALIEVAKKA